MKKKILLFCLILISILFINVGKVNAEEYKAGDLVEIINPSGGESQKFYVVLNNSDSVTLVSKEKFLENEPLKNTLDKSVESLASNNFKYLFEIENTQKDENGLVISFVQDIAVPVFACNINLDKYTNGWSPIEYFNCPKFYENFTGSYTYSFSEEFPIGIFEKSDDPNYQYMIKGYSTENNEVLDKKLNYYLWIEIDSKNLDFLKKTNIIIDEDNKDNKDNNDMQSNNFNANNEVVKNPKTSDNNIVLIIVLITIVSIGSFVSINKLKKLSK